MCVQGSECGDGGIRDGAAAAELARPGIRWGARSRAGLAFPHRHRFRAVHRGLHPRQLRPHRRRGPAARLGQPFVIENRPAPAATPAPRRSPRPRPTATRWGSARRAARHQCDAVRQDALRDGEGNRPHHHACRAAERARPEPNVAAASVETCSPHASASPKSSPSAPSAAARSRIWPWRPWRSRPASSSCTCPSRIAGRRTALLRGDVQMAVLPAASVVPQGREGKLKLLAVTSPRRSAAASRPADAGRGRHRRRRGRRLGRADRARRNEGAGPGEDPERDRAVLAEPGSSKAQAAVHGAGGQHPRGVPAPFSSRSTTAGPPIIAAAGIKAE